MTKKKPPICCIHRTPIADGPVICLRVTIAAGKTKIEKDKVMCVECAGAVTNMFMQLVRQKPEYAPLAGIKLEEKSKILSPHDA